jgi:RND family efflux transporter MFP subunit
MMKQAELSSWTTVALLLASILTGITVVACKPANEYVAPPPPKVTVSQPIQRDVTNYLEFTGNAQAVQHVEVRARVQGFLQSIHFEEGTDVKKGDLLFVIDPRPFEARVSKAQADLSRKKAKLEKARADFNRIETLYRQKAAPKADYVQAKAARDTALADVDAAQAVLEENKLKLSFTRVTAPINGRVGRSLVSAGNLVGAGENTHLTTLVQYDPIWAYFSLNERQVLRLMRQHLEKQANPEVNQEEESVIHLGLADEDGYPHAGQVDYVDQGLDPDTGTFVLRGSFANPKPHAILPGMFVRIRTPIDQRQAALLVSEQALGADQRGRYVLVVNEQNSVEYRSVRVGAAIDGLRVIEKGLQPDDWVVVKGLLRARPGATVTPERQEMMTRLPDSSTTSQ